MDFALETDFDASARGLGAILSQCHDEGILRSNGKHARWWLKLFGSGIKDVQMVYRPGKENGQADALSLNTAATHCDDHLEVRTQVAQVTTVTEKEVSQLLQEEPGASTVPSSFDMEQRKDPELESILAFLEHSELPTNSKEARKVVAHTLHFTVVDEVLCFVDSKAGNRKHVVIPAHLRERESP